jgi:hypothetical protein
MESKIYFGRLDAEDLGPIGSVKFDPSEKVWVMRAAECDEPYSCGFDCCGTAVVSLFAFTADPREATSLKVCMQHEAKEETFVSTDKATAYEMLCAKLKQ